MADVKSSNKVIDISEVVKIMRGLSITKLVNQENFLLWKEDFSTLLECLSWKYEDLKDKNLSTGCSAKIIRLTLSDDLKREFLYTDNSFDLIKDIEMKFKRTTIIDIINLKSELYTFQETDPMTMISRVKSVVMQLKQLDQIINDTEMCHIILTKLDAKYDMMKTTLTDSITLEDLVQRIKSQSDAMVTNDISETSFYVNKKFSLHNRNKNYQIKRNNVKSQLCYNCRGTGHQAKVCPLPSNYVNFSVEDDVDNIIDEDSDYGFFMGTIASMAQTMESLWIIDSGASVHITNEKSKLSNLRPLDKHIPVKTADGTILNIKECGDLYIDKILVKNVLYNENVAANLLSFVKLMEEGLLVSNGSEFKLKQKDVSIPIVSKSGVLIIDQKIRNDRVDDALMWHKRLGHANPRLIKEVTGLSMNNKCIDCASIKITRIPHKIEITANVPLERLSIDLGEPKTSETISGYRYYLVILDIFKNITGHKVRFLRSDKGTEFLNQQVSELCRRRSITQEFTESATPEANPVERYNRTLKNMTGTIIQSQRLPCKLWPEIIQSCAFLRNRLPSATTGIAPLTMLNIKFDLKRIKIIGCLTIMNQHLMNKRNLANRSEVGVLVGFGQSSLSYKVFLFSTGTVVSSCDVWFDESKDFIDSKEYYENNVLKKNKTDVYSSDDENVNDF
uniref:Retrovirus-related Pol polyprotein from transposon TNT 1-94 n=1 Tax=Strongyloides papillosus TaxID=174720 RepID=A0A0N5BMV9_STREA